MTTPIWCPRAWLGGDTMTESVLIDIDEFGVITGIHAGVEAPPGATTLTGSVLPGFVNDHSHAFHRGIRGRTQMGRESFWAWRDQMYALASVLTPESYFVLARATFAEMVEAGFTRVSEFHYLHHDVTGASYANPNEMSQAVIAAAQDAGIRLTLLDTLYLSAAPNTAVEGVQRRFSDGDVDRWVSRTHDLSAASGVQHGLAVHSVRAVSPTDIEVAARVARARSVPLHAHVSEQPRENDECVAAYGRTPTQVFADHGALAADFTAVHATHLTSTDIKLLGQARVCMCPTTEAELADGIGPAGALRDAGAGISLGSDSQAFIDPFAEMQRLEFDQRLDTGRRDTFTAPELAEAGAWQPLGVGVHADLVEIGLDSRRLAGAAAESLANMVFSASSSDIRSVFIGGRLMVNEGRHVRIDVATQLSQSIHILWEGLR